MLLPSRCSAMRPPSLDIEKQAYRLAQLLSTGPARFSELSRDLGVNYAHLRTLILTLHRLGFEVISETTRADGMCCRVHEGDWEHFRSRVAAYAVMNPES